MSIHRKMKLEITKTTLCLMYSKSKVFYSSLYSLVQSVDIIHAFPLLLVLFFQSPALKMLTISKVPLHMLSILAIQSSWKMITFYSKVHRKWDTFYSGNFFLMAFKNYFWKLHVVRTIFQFCLWIQYSFSFIFGHTSCLIW